MNKQLKDTLVVHTRSTQNARLHFEQAMPEVVEILECT
jgi:hypothetical protein